MGVKDKLTSHISQNLGKIFKGGRARVVMIIVIIVIIIGVIFLVHHLTNSTVSASGSQVAAIPSQIQSVPGSNNENQQYMQTLLKSNQQQAQQALQSGQSSIPTLMSTPPAEGGSNYSAQAVRSGGNCGNCCCNGQNGQSGQSQPVSSVLNQMVSSGAISPKTAAKVEALASSGLSNAAYKKQLQAMVKSGDLTQAQADALEKAYDDSQKQAQSQTPNGIVSSLAASGRVSKKTARALRNLGDENLTPTEYAARLNRLVREGKLPPAAAQRLMSAYQKQYAQGNAATNAVLSQLPPATAAAVRKLDQSAQTPAAYQAGLQKMIDSGQLTSGQAKQLMQAYRDRYAKQEAAKVLRALPPQTAEAVRQMRDSAQNAGQYQNDLNRLVREGKLSRAQANQLLAGYKATHSPAAQAAETMSQLPPETAAAVKALENSANSAEDYKKGLDKLVKEGKLTPQQAQALLDTYKAREAAAQGGSTGLQSNQPKPDSIVKDLADSGQITPATQNALDSLNASGDSPEAYKQALQSMVDNGDLTKEQAKALEQAYDAHHVADADDSNEGLVDQLAATGAVSPGVASQLQSLIKSHVTPSQYAQALKSLVSSGQLSPAVAARLLQNYMDTHSPKNLKGVAALQAQQQQQALEQQVDSFNQQAQEDRNAATEKTQNLLSGIESDMGTQAKQLIAAWKPKRQSVEYDSNKGNGKDSHGSNAKGSGSGASGSGQSSVQPQYIKAGDVMFAVLNTAVNSDRPGPVMATIVAGKLKGAKLLGTLQVTPDNERVILSFNSMSMNKWPRSVAIQAVAINPYTAQTAIASDVNHHYLLRYSALFAASFLQGYSTAVLSSGSTTTASIFGGSTTQSKQFSPGEKIAVGLGQIGTNASSEAKQEFNTPPTVTVDSGVGLGILFTQGVNKPDFSVKGESKGAK